MNKVVLFVFLLAVVAWLSTIVQAQFIDDTPDSPHESALAAPKGIRAVIPLDKHDPSYELSDGRKPGPIN